MKPREAISKLLEGVRRLVLRPAESGEDFKPDDNRTSPRILCDYRVELKGKTERFTASAVDIGKTGLRVEGVPTLEVGQVYEISYPYAGGKGPSASFEAEVMWCRPSRKHQGELVAGFRFVRQGDELKGTWVHTLLTELGLAGNAVYQKRRHLRLSTRRKVYLRDLETGRHLLVGRLSNLSVGGALVQSAYELQKGRQVLALIGGSVERPTLTIGAEVIEVRMDPEEGHRLLSLQFVELNEEQLGKLEQMIREMLKGRAL